MTNRIVAAVFATACAGSAQAITLDYDPSPGLPGYAISGFEFNSSSGSLNPSEDRADLTDDDLGTGLNFGRFIAGFDVIVDLNTPTTTDGLGPFGQESRIETNVGATGFLLLPGTTLSLVGANLGNIEPETVLVEVIVEGSAEPIPEPSSLALLGLGGLLIARRRR